MAKGQELKKEIINKLLSTFEGSFLYNDGKEVRICGQENGELIQIKITLTTAKENVEPGADNKMPGIDDNKIDFEASKETQQSYIEPTKEELQNVNDLLKALGL